MRIGILGNEDSWYVDTLCRAAQERGHDCQRLDFRQLAARVLGPCLKVTAGPHQVDTLDAVIVRTMPPGSLEQVVYRMDVLQRLEAAGTIVFNPPRAIECAVDKFLTTARLAARGLPTPRTIVCETWEQAEEAFAELGEDVVVKPLFGSEGRGILRVSDPDLAHRVFKAIERTQGVIYLQEFVPHAGFDVRVLVLGGEVLGGIERRNPQDFRTNVARNGTATAHVVTDEEAQLALRAAEAVGACFAGVDLLYDPQGACQVIEVNAVPGWRAFEKATGVEVAGRVLTFLEKQVRERSPR